jgi:hypothetical protein
VPSERDSALAREVAEFIAERAFDFAHYECRAWALTDFGAWVSLAGNEPRLTVGPPADADDQSAS